MLLLLSGPSGPGRGPIGSGRCGHSWRGRRGLEGGELEGDGERVDGVDAAGDLDLEEPE